jgi:hypothetical protein
MPAVMTADAGGCHVLRSAEALPEFLKIGMYHRRSFLYLISLLEFAQGSIETDLLRKLRNDDNNDDQNRCRKGECSLDHRWFILLYRSLL